MSTLKEQFEAAQTKVKSLKAAPSNTDLLNLYALYKQASAGDVQGSRPGMMDFKGRAKFDAWAGQKGVSAETAMTSYLALVDRLAK